MFWRPFFDSRPFSRSSLHQFDSRSIISERNFRVSATAVGRDGVSCSHWLRLVLIIIILTSFAVRSHLGRRPPFPLAQLSNCDHLVVIWSIGRLLNIFSRLGFRSLDAFLCSFCSHSVSVPAKSQGDYFLGQWPLPAGPHTRPFKREYNKPVCCCTRRRKMTTACSRFATNIPDTNSLKHWNTTDLAIERKGHSLDYDRGCRWNEFFSFCHNHLDRKMMENDAQNLIWVWWKNHLIIFYHIMLLNEYFLIKLVFYSFETSLFHSLFPVYRAPDSTDRVCLTCSQQNFISTSTQQAGQPT